MLLELFVTIFWCSKHRSPIGFAMDDSTPAPSPGGFFRARREVPGPRRGKLRQPSRERERTGPFQAQPTKSQPSRRGIANGGAWPVLRWPGYSR